MTVFLNGKFLEKSEAAISPDDRGFLFADGVYEVLRSYQGVLFRAEDHWRRLMRSLDAIRITAPDPELLPHVAKELIHRNGLQSQDSTVYIQVTRGAAPRRHAFPGPDVKQTIYAFAAPLVPRRTRQPEGASVILVPDLRWSRCDIKSLGLLPNVLAGQQAVDNDADEAVFVRDARITEGTCTSTFAVVDGTVRTHPADHHVLHGVSRLVALELCAKLGIPARESALSESEFRSADEAFLAGTTIEILPIVKVEGMPVGKGAPGPISLQLQQAFRKLTGR